MLVSRHVVDSFSIVRQLIRTSFRITEGTPTRFSISLTNRLSKIVAVCFISSCPPAYLEGFHGWWQGRIAESGQDD